MNSISAANAGSQAYQHVFDARAFAFSPVPTACGGRCVAYDWENDVRHQHCTVIVAGSMEAGDAKRCNALVLVTQDGPQATDITIDDAHGFICSECGDVTCKACIVTNTPTGKPLCANCHHEAVHKIDETDKMFRAIDDAKTALTAYLEGLRAEQNPVKIRETVHGLHEINDLYEQIMRELAPNVERAYGLQQRLPGAA